MEGTQELKVLLIEDNPGDAFLIKFYLGESVTPAFQVSHAENMKSALEFLGQSKYDIIISDMNMPDSFGVDTIKTILGNYPGNLVIVLTGLTDEEVGLETVRYGAQDFLVKGKFDGKVLISSVMFAFERFKLNKEIDEENSRLSNLQKLLNVGYFEVSEKEYVVFKTDYTFSLLGYDSTGNKSIEAGFSKLLSIPDFKAAVDHVMANKSRSEFNFILPETGKQFNAKVQYCSGKACGVLMPVA